MVQSDAKTVDDYLAELPGDRRETVSAIRQVLLEHLPDGYVETMQYGMISYVIPLERYPITYNGQPLGLAALASQKNYISLYLMNIYSDAETESWFVERWTASGKKLNKGKSCIRFRRLEDVPLDVVGDAISRTSVEEYIARYKQSRTTRSKPGQRTQPPG